jgi:hypothetical protein
MATLTVIDAAKAPPRLTAATTRHAEFDGYVNALKKGQAGKLVPTGAESARSLAIRIAWASRRTGKLVEKWIVDGVLYFKVL